MALRDKLRENVRPFLDDGEQIQGILSAQTTSPYWSLLSLWIVVFSNGYRTVVATDRRILVLRNSRASATKMTSVDGEFPRRTVLGPASGLWFKTEALGEKMFVHTRFHKDVTEIDSFTGAVPGHPNSPMTPPTG